jgi:2-desacetyl-2-hydroxyethyl bacteriochlorophyllide A dehydrogenase
MKKLVWHGRDVVELEIDDAEMPKPQKNEVVVKIRSVGICGTDIHILKGRFPLAKPPLILGHEIAGEIVRAGSTANRLSEGDRVTVDSVVGCGHCFLCKRGSSQFCSSGFEFGITKDGGCQEYLVVPRNNVYSIPKSLSFEEAAILDIEVYNAILKCRVETGDRILILGAGPIGLIACQVARILGAGHVCLMDPLPERTAAAQRLGVADEYRRPPEGSQNVDESERNTYDLVIDCAGNARSTFYALDCVRPSGKVLLYGVHEDEIERLDLNRIILKDLILFGAQSDRRNWEDVIALAANGGLNLKALITHEFPLEEGMRAYDLVKNRTDGVIKAVLVI